MAWDSVTAGTPNKRASLRRNHAEIAEQAGKLPASPTVFADKTSVAPKEGVCEHCEIRNSKKM